MWSLYLIFKWENLHQSVKFQVDVNVTLTVCEWIKVAVVWLFSTVCTVQWVHIWILNVGFHAVLFSTVCGFQVASFFASFFASLQPVCGERNKRTASFEIKCKWEHLLSTYYTHPQTSNKSERESHLHLNWDLLALHRKFLFILKRHRKR